MMTVSTSLLQQLLPMSMSALGAGVSAGPALVVVVVVVFVAAFPVAASGVAVFTLSLSRFVRCGRRCFSVGGDDAADAVDANGRRAVVDDASQSAPASTTPSRPHPRGTRLRPFSFLAFVSTCWLSP